MAGNVKMTPNAEVPPPTQAQLWDALQRVRPGLQAPIEALGEGWAFFAYRAGDVVMRFPKRGTYVETVHAEAALLRELAPTLPLAVPQIDVHDDGPGGLPFTSHRFVPGSDTAHLNSSGAEALGRFLRTLQAFPAQRAQQVGIKVQDGAGWRFKTAGNYETVIRRVFPLVSSEARVMTEQAFETYLKDDANFSFEPLLQHGDINPCNVLADPASGELSGVIDFGNVYIGDPALDLADLLEGDFSRSGALAHRAAFERGFGQPLAGFESRCRFYAFCWPLNHVTEGLDTNDAEFIEDGIKMMNAKAAAGRGRCDV